MKDASAERFEEARQHMIDGQFRPNEVNDGRVIAAFKSIPREQFVPKTLRGVAYVDEDLAIGSNRYLMEPMVFARLIEAADIEDEDTVLIVGAGSGYSAAVVAQLCETVVALEEDADLVKKAEAALQALDIHSVPVLEGSLNAGAAKQGPYSVIILEGAVDHIPDGLGKQLAEGGRLVCVKTRDRVGRAHIAVKTAGILSGRDLFDANVAPLPGFQAEKKFEF